MFSVSFAIVMEEKRRKRRVFVAMSGGVDSSVAAALLRDQKYEVTGIHLKSWNVDGCGEQDAEDARRAAEHLGIPFYVFDVEREYRARVVDYMVRGYKEGITPTHEIKLTDEDREAKRDPQLEKAKEVLRELIKKDNTLFTL